MRNKEFISVIVLVTLILFIGFFDQIIQRKVIIEINNDIVKIIILYLSFFCEILLFTGLGFILNTYSRFRSLDAFKKNSKINFKVLILGSVPLIILVLIFSEISYIHLVPKLGLRGEFFLSYIKIIDRKLVQNLLSTVLGFTIGSSFIEISQSGKTSSNTTSK